MAFGFAGNFASFSQHMLTDPYLLIKGNWVAQRTTISLPGFDCRLPVSLSGRVKYDMPQ